jgi:hypothetical protein
LRGIHTPFLIVIGSAIILNKEQPEFSEFAHLNVNVFHYYFMGFVQCRNNTLDTSLGRYKGLENPQTSKQNKETNRCPIKFHLQQSITAVCKVFDESPTPEQEGFSQLRT